MNGNSNITCMFSNSMGSPMLISQETCPPVAKKGICKNCSYFDFCYINEMEEEE